MKRSFLYILFLLFALSEISAETWTNPIRVNQEWPGIGVPDPYILKYRGLYYLYGTGSATGIRSWVSKDLINWSGPHLCSSEGGAYAPEVVYWNGTFYMYTSPLGNGHYVLTSTSPTGPFTRATDNLGKSIDGNVFIEDDGKWYFYHSGGGSRGIQGCSMNSPTSIGNGRNLGVSMNNDWTEGPSVIKRNDVYYIIYTGNHFLSKGYRIDYAKNTNGPLATFTPQSRQNPILINTEGANVGLGHGCPIIGPDLDSYYYAYHNLDGTYRMYNLDRIAWNGDKMTILGPTVWGQQAPDLADFVDYFDRISIGGDWTRSGGNWGITAKDFLYQNVSNGEAKILNDLATGDNYTAEFTLRSVGSTNTNSTFGAVFGYTNESNYGVVAVRDKTNKLEVRFKVNGAWSSTVSADLPLGFNSASWHAIRIEKSGEDYKFFIDGMKKASLKNQLGRGRIGYITNESQANFGYIAFSNKVNGSGIFDVYKPIPGTIEAVHYKTGGEGVGYHELTQGNSGGKYIREDDVDISDCIEGGHAITAIQTGEWYAYNVNTRYPLAYNVGIRYASTQDASIKILQDDEVLMDNIELPSTGGAWRTAIVKDLKLTHGYHSLKIEAISGEFSLYTMQFDLALNRPATKEDNFDRGFIGWYYSDGPWEIRSQQAYIDGYGKRTMITGIAPWTDYTTEVDVTYAGTNMNGGLLLRANNLSLGEDGTSAQAGSDFLQAYYVNIDRHAVVLGKQNYNWTHLKSASGNYTTNKKYKLKADIRGDEIKVYVDDVLVLEYVDHDPFVSGRPGLRVHNSEVYFDNFKATVLEDETSSVPNIDFSENEILIYPNPVTTLLSIHNTSDFSELLIFNVNGQKMHHSKLASENSLVVDVGAYQNGFYLLELRGVNKRVVKRFIKNQ